jgi:hypothetical protein
MVKGMGIWLTRRDKAEGDFYEAENRLSRIALCEHLARAGQHHVPMRGCLVISPKGLTEFYDELPLASRACKLSRPFGAEAEASGH